MARDHSVQISEGRLIIAENLDVQTRFTVSGLHTEHSLEIARVEPHDTGTYTCTLLSSPPAHRSYQLAVFQPPVFLRDKSSLSNSLSAAQLRLTEDAPRQSISLTCVGLGLPDPTVGWWLVQRRLAIKDGDPTLTFRLVEEKTALATGVPRF